MDAEVDVSKQDGKMLADATRTAPVAQTQVYDALAGGADAEVKRVIAANSGGARPAVAKAPVPATHAAGASAAPIARTASAAH
jgi:membrane fusion protein (multidrug efflux system)